MIQEKSHIDGIWKTTESTYRCTTIVIKARQGHNIKGHCYFKNQVIFTLRFSFIKPEDLLKKIEDKVDKWLSGEWTPKKLIKNGKNRKRPISEHACLDS